MAAMPQEALGLDESLDGAYSVPEVPEERVHFTVDNLEKAAWAMRKLAHIRKKQAEIQSIADKEIMRIQYWAEDQKKGLEDDARYFEGLLMAYHQSVYADDPKAKTIKLPHGELTARKQQDDWRIMDEVFIQAAKELGLMNLIRVKEEPNKTELKKALWFDPETGKVIDPETGAVVDGVTVIPGGVKFSVKVVD